MEMGEEAGGTMYRPAKRHMRGGDSDGVILYMVLELVVEEIR